MIETIKAILFGIIEGITEWLPISSTGHMILLDEFVRLHVSDDAAFNDAFYSFFEVVIQLGAILAVILLYFRKLNPFAPSKSSAEKKETWMLWLKVLVALLPSVVLGFLLDDWMDAHLYNPLTVSIALMVYGVAFLFVEKIHTAKKWKMMPCDKVDGISVKTALFIGIFQCLALIPGTSRSGSTILGAMLLGLSRTAAAEFSFFLAIPTMAGASVLRGYKFVRYLGETGTQMPGIAWVVLAVACAVAFLVSLAAIRFLTDFVKRHSFAPFGIYRIALGLLVLLYFAIAR